MSPEPEKVRGFFIYPPQCDSRPRHCARRRVAKPARKDLFNLTLISQIEQIFLIFLYSVLSPFGCGRGTAEATEKVKAAFNLKVLG